MNSINQIRDKLRELLDDLDDMDPVAANAPDNQSSQTSQADHDPLEIPDLICSVVDYLQPIMKPYEAAIYWNLLRNSKTYNGKQYVRASVRGLERGVILSASGQTDDLSYNSVMNAMRGLMKKGVLKKLGDPNREGTPYIINLPDEIPDLKTKNKKDVPI